MIKFKALKVVTLSVMMVLSAIQLHAQRSDGFFQYSNDDTSRDYNIINLGSSGGISIEGMDNENPSAPLGDGLFIMLAAGAVYALSNRKRALKTGTLVVAALLLLGMTQCKKKTVQTNSTGTIHMTLETACSGGKSVFNPEMIETGAPGFTWNDGGYEYMSVSGSIQGYLGELRADASGYNVQHRMVFYGNITTPLDGEKIYFFYVGNGSHIQETGTEMSIIDFSDQCDGSTSTVTNLLIAADSGTITQIDEHTYMAYADLKVKTAIAYFNLSGFVNSSDDDETIYLHGDGIYSTAIIDYKNGTITGKDKGYINVGTNGEKYVALIPSTEDETMLQFDSNSKTAGITFSNGIRKKKFYSNDLAPLPVTVEHLPEKTLPGLFSVSPYKMVRFSTGNLKYSRNNTTADWTSDGSWEFMENQYDIVEVADHYDQSYASWYHDVGDDYSEETTVSFMGLGTTGKNDLAYPYKNPYDTDAEYEYGPNGNLSVAEGTDWGWCMGGPDSPWRTLSADEFSWLLGMANGNAYTWTENPGVNCRKASTINGVENARFTRARIEDFSKTSDGVNGMVIFPDIYVHPDDVPALNYINYFGGNESQFSKANVLTVDEWRKMEAAGAVFLPAAGQRYVNWNTWESVTYSTDVNIGGHYWTSYGSTYNGRTLFFDGGHATFQMDMKLLGRSVRLVYDPQD